jgi:predicted dehydrogenase
MDKVRAGIIGCGGIAKTHAAALAELSEVTFAACCDIDEARVRGDRKVVVCRRGDWCAAVA